MKPSRLPLPGELVASGAWDHLLMAIWQRRSQEETVLVPAVPEPQIVWLMDGSVELDEREIGGEWSRVMAEAGDMFLTNSASPYEVRWRTRSPVHVMELYVGLPLLALATGGGIPELREFSGQKDETMAVLLEQLRQELVERPTSEPFVQGIGQALAVHLVRTYALSQPPRRPAGLTAFQLQQINQFLEENLDDSVSLGEMARLTGLSEFHFSRLFKKTTGFSPSRYLIRQRIARARQLLRETDKSILDTSLEVGYSSASHFTDVFRREVGLTPSDYRRRFA